MNKYVFCFLLAVSSAHFAQAQSSRDTLLMVPGKDGAYFYHVVNAKETIYSLSRTYGLEPRLLASFNGLTLKTPLKIYQLLKIPLTGADLDQASDTRPAGAVPLFHKVTRGETLYHISKLQGGVPVPLLKRWNELKSNDVHPGAFLVVGWLKKAGSVARAASTPVTSSVAEPATATAAAEPETPPASPAVKKAEAHGATTARTTAPASKPAAAKAAAASSSVDDGFLGEVIASENARRGNQTKSSRSTAPASRPKASGNDDAFSVSPSPAPRSTPAPAKAAPRSPEPVREPTPKATAVAKPLEPAPGADQPAPTPKKRLPAPGPTKPDSFAVLLNKVTTSKTRHQDAAAQAAPRAETTRVAPSRPGAAQPEAPQGPAHPEAVQSDAATPPATVTSEFQTLFDRQTANGTHVAVKKGAAGWFKSNVKPGSGRYYALCNDLARGTIIRVVNPINQKSVLVKVLDVIPRQKDNYNLIIKLSDAAMSDLGVTQSRFWCEINYPDPEK